MFRGEVGPEFPGEGAIPSIQYIAGSSLKNGSGNTPKKRKIECALVTHQKNQKMENQVLVWNLKLLLVFSQARFWKHTQKKKNWLRMCSYNTPKKSIKGKSSVSLEPNLLLPEQQLKTC